MTARGDSRRPASPTRRQSKGGGKSGPPKRTVTKIERRIPTTVSREERKRVRDILRRLALEYPDAECALHFQSPYELLVATILSAQCTDTRVNLVTPAVFKAFPDARALAGAELDTLQELIRTTGFFRNKARNLVGAASEIVKSYKGQVPRNIEDLLRLPGVARKTANVVLGTAFGIASGVVVDTHVSRLSQRLALTEQTDPVKIEQDLMKRIPREEWIDFSHRLIDHGRRICSARKPKCESCVLLDLCPYPATRPKSGTF